MLGSELAQVLVYTMFKGWVEEVKIIDKKGKKHKKPGHVCSDKIKHSLREWKKIRHSLGGNASPKIYMCWYIPRYITDFKKQEIKKRKSEHIKKKLSKFNKKTIQLKNRQNIKMLKINPWKYAQHH